ncbi:peptidoglycan DD-metalloendopeptidase family protein [Neiella marina]|uniref:Peptidoglycan DD-metalloendopeptidase family protein n=1 Tax=Neiella holothuriorum TaxID=2870530 RepID=A0ABS7EB88_9GAMM|nr:peptidoglycan DD-metalloendopeptidase family protein [Neiella holothuriorum]
MINLWLLVLLGLIGCAGQPQNPAPVRSVTKDYSDYNRATISGKSYQVKAGDTLYSIAWASGVDHKKLIQINKIKSPFVIHPGQVLSLKCSSTSSSSSNKIVASSNSSAHQQNKIDSGHKNPVDSTKAQGYRQVKAGQERSSTAQTNPRPYGRVKQWLWPTKGTLSGRFSTANLGSKGIDISGKFGQAITASADGKVVYAGSGLRGYGELIIIKHSDDFLSAYAHNSAIRVAEGQWVKAGQLIANMGSTGTDAVKLHFEIRFKGKPVDPLKYLPK